METLILTLDTIALIVVLYWSYKSEASPGKSELGPFAIRSPSAEPPSDTKPAARPGPRPPARRR